MRNRAVGINGCGQLGILGVIGALALRISVDAALTGQMVSVVFTPKG